MPSRNRRQDDRRFRPRRTSQEGNQPAAGKSSSRRRTGRSSQPPASKAQLAGLRQAATEQAETLQTGDDWLRLLRYAEHFHTYGGVNALLIVRDRPYATRLATYDQWKRDGHPVQRGEHGIALLDPADPSRTLRAFDITQTGQPPAPGPLRHLRPVRHTAKALQLALTSIAMRKKLDVVTDAVSNAHGRAAGIPARTALDEGTIHLHPGLSPDAACYALAHELAHVLMHTPDRLNPATGACDSIGLIEAESVAYILCRNAGLDVTPFTFPDPTTWAGADPRSNTGATVLLAIERIATTAHRLIRQADATDPAGPNSSPGPPPPTQKSQPPTKAEPPAPTRQTGQTAEPQPDLRLAALHQHAEQFFTSRLPGSWVPGYLATRGLAAALDNNAPWAIGYAPATWTALVDHLRATGYTDEEIITSGLGKRSRKGDLIDRFRDRLMLPVRAPDGTTIAFIGRVNPDTPPSGTHPVPKYLNSPQTPLYTKGAILYGLDTAAARVRRGAIPVLVEGTLDAIAIHLADHGHRYAPVAPSGTALTKEQVAALTQAVDLNERGILAVFDGDEAGQKAAARAYRLLRPYTDRLHQARLAAADDPAGLLENHGPHRLLTALSDRRPLAAAVIDVHLDGTRDLPEWQRRDHAAQLITKLMPPDKIRQLAAASVPSPTSAPANAAPLPTAAAADLMPYVTKALILHAADDIGIPVTEQINAVVDAASDQPLKTSNARPDDDQSSPAVLAARDGPAPPVSLSGTPVAGRQPPAPVRYRPANRRS